jgi:hypothetical protein
MGGSAIAAGGKVGIICIKVTRPEGKPHPFSQATVGHIRKQCKGLDGESIKRGQSFLLLYAAALFPTITGPREIRQWWR